MTLGSFELTTSARAGGRKGALDLCPQDIGTGSSGSLRGGTAAMNARGHRAQQLSSGQTDGRRLVEVQRAVPEAAKVGAGVDLGLQ